MTNVVTSVQPVPIASPFGWEIAVPFQIDPVTGGVAKLTTEIPILEQHIATIINTQLGERVMFPAYGTNVPSDVFAPQNEALSALLTSDIERAIQAWEPAVTVQQVTVTPDATTHSAVIVNVSYTVRPFNDLNLVSVNIGGSIFQVVSPS